MLTAIASVIGAVQLTLAIFIFHRAAPTVLGGRRRKVFKIWLLGFALGCFGVGNMFGIRGETIDSFALVTGHAALAAYGAYFLYEKTKGCTCRWWVTSRLFKTGEEC